MKVEWTRPALADLIEAQTYITRDNPRAAEVVARRVWEASKRLGENPAIGRPGHVAGTREWVVTRTPYLIVYRERAGRIEILRIWHGRQNWQAQTETPGHSR